MGADPLDALRRAVPDWSDDQLRRAWGLTTLRHAVVDAATAAQREVLLAEWERRHPRQPLDWDGFFLR